MKRPHIFHRNGELWIGHWGFFWGRITGIELPNGDFHGFTYGI